MDPHIVHHFSITLQLIQSENVTNGLKKLKQKSYYTTKSTTLHPSFPREHNQTGPLLPDSYKTTFQSQGFSQVTFPFQLTWPLCHLMLEELISFSNKAKTIYKVRQNKCKWIAISETKINSYLLTKTIQLSWPTILNNSNSGINKCLQSSRKPDINSKCNH